MEISLCIYHSVTTQWFLLYKIYFSLQAKIYL